jgi:hypothetical protein
MKIVLKSINPINRDLAILLITGMVLAVSLVTGILLLISQL